MNIKLLTIELFFALSKAHGKTTTSGLWCLTPLSTIFQLYRGDLFYWWRSTRRKPPSCRKSL